VTKTLNNAWKLSVDEKAYNSTWLPNRSLSYDERTGFVPKDPDSFGYDIVIGGPTKFAFLVLDSPVQISKHIEKPTTSQFDHFHYLGYDILESEKKIITGLTKPLDGGNLIYAIDIASGEHTEIRREAQEKGFDSACLLRGSSPLFVGSNWANGPFEIRTFDANSGRPLSRWTVPERCHFISSDPLNPNLFYVQQRGSIIVFDKSVKNQVRGLMGLSNPSEIQVPWFPGNQLISNNREEAKIWDLGTGKVLHTITGLKNGYRSSLYGNVAAIADNTMPNGIMRIYDLNEDASQPAKNIECAAGFGEVWVTPKRIVAACGVVWASTPFQ